MLTALNKRPRASDAFVDRRSQWLAQIDETAAAVGLQFQPLPVLVDLANDEFQFADPRLVAFKQLDHAA